MEIIQVQQSSENAEADPTLPHTQLKPKRRRPTKAGDTQTTENARHRRLRIPAICGAAIFRLKQELGLRSSGETIHWLLRQVRPELVPANPKPPNSSRPLNSVNSSVTKPLCMAYQDNNNPASHLPINPGCAPAARPLVRATVVQASTVFFDTPATLDKAERLIAGAAAYGSRLVVFPEAFVGGYPRCVTFDAAASTAIHSTETDDDDELQKYYASAIDVPGPEFDRLAKIASKYKVHLVMGVVERAGFYLYSTVLFFDSMGRHLGLHRKLMPSASERAVWYSGEKSSLPIYETRIGKIGGLICWDNKLPLLRTKLYSKGVEIYCAPTADAGEAWKASMIHIALEGGCFVLSANQFCLRRDYPLPPGDSNGDISLDAIESAGGSVIVSPVGTLLAGPNYHGECLISADLDLGEITPANIDFGGAESDAGPNHVGWTANGLNPMLFPTDMQIEIPDKLLW